MPLFSTTGISRHEEINLPNTLDRSVDRQTHVFSE